MTPAARITLDGQDVTTAWRSVLEGLTVTDEAGIKSDTCEVIFDDREYFSAPPIGAEIKVWLGYEPEPVYLGRFKVDRWEKSGMPRRLSVSAKAADLTGAIKAAKTRSHHQTTIGAIVRKIAGEHRLAPVIDERIDARPITHIDQQTESDLGFLSRLAKRNGATFKVADGRLIFAAKGSRTTPNGQAKSSVTITPPDCAFWRIASEERGAFKTVICCYMDHGAGRRIAVRAGSGEPEHRDKRLYGSKAEAEAAARAQLGDLTRGKMTGDLDLVGNPFLFAEALVTLNGFDPDADGEYLAKSVTHTFDAGGYRTSLALETEGDTETDSAEFA